MIRAIQAFTRILFFYKNIFTHTHPLGWKSPSLIIGLFLKESLTEYIYQNFSPDMTTFFSSVLSPCYDLLRLHNENAPEIREY